MHGHRVAAAGPDDGPVGDVSVHPLSVERALGHVEERDVGVLLVLRAAAVRVVAQPAVSVGVADAVEGRADRVRDADSLPQFATASRMWLCVLYVDPPAVPALTVSA